MDVCSAARMMLMDIKHRLRRLGLSSNGLNSKTVEALLEPLKTNKSLTILDLSYNEVENSKESNIVLRTFVRCNSGLKYLDLCCNRLNKETYGELHLGLLENHTMLLLPLAGNLSVDLSPTIHLIQVKLRKNRLAYKANTQENDCTCQGRGGGGGDPLAEHFVHQQQ
jgi:Leucine-rich repeat (LRR) protein